ncbi:GFA family protein [Methylonatrum kenyense]|uniref:GFA family protein n=1 Tax=Methylonatrum kenyense TaxID=455253 RepID=UPI0020C0BB58|nr:GFA family protein [Methylonatrum kenyense]MCK8515232.1 GFA family protein [Methylonatrum kenyense]
MDSSAERHGVCLCGAVRLRATPKSSQIGVCHCDMCRQWGGGPLFAAECGDAVEFEGADQISVYASSEWAERGFCRTCGTHLFYRLKEDDFYAIPIGLFQDSAPWVLAEQIFIDRKPSFYSFAETTRNLTGEQLFAQYSQK